MSNAECESGVFTACMLYNEQVTILRVHFSDCGFDLDC